jgi:bacterioferritin-associated ferredoxin
MYICICKKITDYQIRKAVLDHSVSNVRELRYRLDACNQCGKCASEARQIIKETVGERLMLESHGLHAKG